MRRGVAFLLLALLSPLEATESSDALARFLEACDDTGWDRPASAATAFTVVTYAGEGANSEGTFGGKFNHLPSHDYQRLQGAEYVEKAVRVGDGWAFRRIVTEQKGERKPDRDEMDAWRRGKALVRTKGKDLEVSGEEVLLEPREVLKGLVEDVKGGRFAHVFLMKDPETGWKASGDVLTWTCTDPERLEAFARSTSTRRWLREARRFLPGMSKSVGATGTLTVTLGKDGRIAKAVRKVEIRLPCRESAVGKGCRGCVLSPGESLEATWGYASPEVPEVPEEVRKRLGWSP